VRGLYDLGYNTQQIREIFRLIDWMALTEPCGLIPESTANRVRDLTADQLQRLGKDLLRIKSVADLESWLDQHASENT
jgi:hypothetical protein